MCLSFVFLSAFNVQCSMDRVFNRHWDGRTGQVALCLGFSISQCLFAFSRSVYHVPPGRPPPTEPDYAQWWFGVGSPVGRSPVNIANFKVGNSPRPPLKPQGPITILKSVIL